MKKLLILFIIIFIYVYTQSIDDLDDLGSSEGELYNNSINLLEVSDKVKRVTIAAIMFYNKKKYVMLKIDNKKTLILAEQDSFTLSIDNFSDKFLVKSVKENKAVIIHIRSGKDFTIL